MGVTLRSIIIAAMLTVVAALLYHFSSLTGRLSNEEISNRYPTFVSKNFKAELYDTEGNITHSMFTDEVKYHENKKLIEVTGIDGIFYEKRDDAKSNEGWNLKAKEGVIVYNDYADLKGGVSITPLTPSASEVQEVATAAVHFDINSKIISSPEEISIRGTRFTNTGSDYVIDLNKKTIVIKDNPHAVYNP